MSWARAAIYNACPALGSSLNDHPRVFHHGGVSGTLDHPAILIHGTGPTNGNAWQCPEFECETVLLESML